MNQDHQLFEDDVRRIARLLWPSAEYSGSEKIGGRERDGVFATEDLIHLVEATVSKTKKKAEDDIAKLLALCRQMRNRHPTKGIQGWFITREEPTADQRSVAQKYPDQIRALSFDQFRSKIVQSSTYLDLRQKYAFGSARDPETGAIYDRTPFVEPVILKRDGTQVATDQISAMLREARRVLLLGDFGSGKSSSGRVVYSSLASAFRQGKESRFPLFLNLRDHHGQNDPVEALERHGRRIAFPSPPQLVRAWRAGYVTLILDGFDEIATPGWVGQVRKLRDIRYQSIELVRAFMRETPLESGILLSGREHFFDSPAEMYRSMNLDETVIELRLAEFTEKQITEFLAARGWRRPIPEWLPARPLLLAYLSSRRDVSDKTKTILEDILDKAAEHTPAAGWDYLLQKISDREADIEAGIDGTAVRLILEKLASRARCEMEDVGPITQNTILEVFRDVCGYSPDDRALVLLQRLPGLGPLSAEDGTRCFVDGDLALAASAGEVYRFIENPYTQKKEWFAFQFGLGQLGIEVAAHLCGTTGSSKGRLSTALKQASIAAGLGILASDLVRVCISIGCGYSGEKVFIREAIVPELEFVNEMAPLNELEFQDCLVMRLDLPPFVAGQDLPRFIRTSFGTVLGRIGRQDLPDVFTECDFDRFAESAHSTSAILDMPIPLGARVMLTILKKLFVQRGSGRKETALYRGLDHKGKRLVPSILALLVREQLVLKLKGATEPVWLPAREHSARIRRLLSAPSKSEDPLIQLASTIAD